MSKRTFAILIAALLAASAANAQYGGGGGGMGGGMGGGGMGGGHRGGGRQRQDPDPPPAAPNPEESRPTKPQTALAKVQIIGEIKAIDPAAGRVTISYDDVDALNWPRGTTPFAVEKPSLLTGLSVGEKVRFHVESQQVSSIEPIGPSASPGTR